MLSIAAAAEAGCRTRCERTRPTAGVLACLQCIECGFNSRRALRWTHHASWISLFYSWPIGALHIHLLHPFRTHRNADPQPKVLLTFNLREYTHRGYSCCAGRKQTARPAPSRPSTHQKSLALSLVARCTDWLSPSFRSPRITCASRSMPSSSISSSSHAKHTLTALK